MTNSNGCQYKCVFHKGKIEWHHPISSRPQVGIYLCEAHHSLLQGRKHRYFGEAIINKTLDEMRVEIAALLHQTMSEDEIKLIDKE